MMQFQHLTCKFTIVMSCESAFARIEVFTLFEVI